MCRFIESIRLEEGKFGNLNYHQSRMDRAMDEFYHSSPKINLKEFLYSCPIPSIGLHKVRLTYDNEIQYIQISLYTARMIKKLKLVHHDSISYSHKFEDRIELEKLLPLRGDCDGIIIAKNNMITDTSFANLVFKKGKKWFTPSTYLLNGTTRQQLLDQEIIFEEEISIADLSKYQKVKLINSMLLFNAREIDVSKIVE
jgi:4-amino-4-deoxychorismate lyase